VPHQSIEEIVGLLEAARVETVPQGPYVRTAAASYRQMSHEVLRQSHAHDAVERPDAAARYEHAATAMHLWTRQGPGGAPWVALVSSVSRTEKGIVPNAGYRVLTESPEEAAGLARDPSRALATLLIRHGVSYYDGRQRIYFTPQHLVNLPGPLETLGPDAFARAVGLEEPAQGSQVAVNVAVSTGRDGRARLSWLFVLDLTAYEREARARHR
jgi:hypothetical protein